MGRSFVACVVLALCPACSLILNFNNNQIPIDAEIDGPYTADECAFLEPNDTQADAMAVNPGDMGPAAICKQPKDSGLPDDVDFYKFTVPMGTTKVTITTTFVVRAGGDLDLKLWDSTMTNIAKSIGLSDTEKLVCPGTSPPCPTLAAGDYAFEVLPANPGYVNSYMFSLELN